MRMKLPTWPKNSLLALWAVFALAACGGGGGGGGVASGGVTGTGKPASATGTVNGFGSVIVNGVHWESDGANIIINGAANRAQSDLAVGMVVRVSGALGANGTRSAATIEYDSDLQGAIDAGSIQLAANGGGTFSVLGQAVSVDRATVFVNAANFAALAAGTPIEVSGLREPSGTIRATRIVVNGKAPAGSQVRGTITEVNATTFKIGSLSVDFAGAQQVNFPMSGLARGLFVVVRATQPPIGNPPALLAARVEVETQGAPDQTNANVQGFVADFAQASFTLNGQSVSIDANSVIVGGALANGVRCEIEGSVVNSVLIAARIVIKSEPNVQIAAGVSSITPATKTFTLLGTPGVTVQVTDDTAFIDAANPLSQTFNFAGIQVGNELSVIGAKDATGVVVADVITKVSDTPLPGSLVTLASPVDSAATPNVVILGVTVQTATTTEFTGALGAPLTQSAFFAQVKPGDTVSVFGTQFGNVVNAITVALQPK